VGFQNLGFRVKGEGCTVEGVGCKVYGLGVVFTFRVYV
jgi:hypothetical protein